MQLANNSSPFHKIAFQLMIHRDLIWFTFFEQHIYIRGLFNTKANSCRKIHYLTLSCRDKGIHTVPKGINSKVYIYIYIYVL